MNLGRIRLKSEDLIFRQEKKAFVVFSISFQTFFVQAFKIVVDS